MPSTADELAAAVAELRPVANDLALPDTCAVTRKGTATTDSRGNKTYPDVTASSPRCRLRTGGQLRPNERAFADRIQSVAPYAIDLPYGTDVTARDVLIVNTTRRFEIVGVLEEGGFGVFTVAIAEERS